MSNFTVDISNRVNNTVLRDSKALWPLFEAILNSIQSIEDSPNAKSGRIDIFAKREDSTQYEMTETTNTKPTAMPFEIFQITDNGSGFTSDNYKSFKTSDSSYKIEKGCKGIGRFLWLVAFDSISIRSNYYEQNQWLKRDFTFSTDGTNPDDEHSSSDLKELSTIVVLSGFKKKYRSVCPIGLEILAYRIVEHCLLYFLSEGCPVINLHDNLGDSINLNSYFTSEIKDSIHKDIFNVGNEMFTLYHLRMPEGVSKHELHLCANRREVISIDLSNHIKNLQKKIVSKDGDESKGFYYLGYIIGKYLDSHANSSRTTFDFPKEDNLVSSAEDGVSQNGLINAAKGFIETYLSDYLKVIAENKHKRITAHVHQKQPQYRYLLKNRPSIFDNIPADLTDEKLDMALYEEMVKWEFETKQEGAELQEQISKGSSSTDKIKDAFDKYCKAINDISKTSLAEYVIRRKAILDLLEKTLQVDASGNYGSEESLHSIICPMRYSSDEISFEEMNLWIIDERLSYHNYLASDKSMSSIPVIDSSGGKEMDIAIFNQAFAYGEDDNPFNSITIIEFKKPNRDDFKPDDKNPINQVLGYVSDIKAGKKMRVKGRPFGNVANAAFYCYVIADLTPSMKEDALNAGLIATPDAEGYFGYNTGRGAYVEVISYNKLLNDAKKRNRVLFDKLFTPSPNQVLSKELSDDS